ncbi:ABC transporter substrate-binding protein [Arsenicitalea aurantiaca]|uniref:ABC transporter substrate-binding protein n=1 Tax=Arsenicitalea aurantiaca TaxID=1783274 RepID=A0A433XAY8_9HYPH|nr:ABC transporter substrate-binding protein [Arsenicitalea aurantiaca]RUT31222.1 ABC transporter substrate-binding protein [Arsenicitalea aurantiaca]
MQFPIKTVLYAAVASLVLIGAAQAQRTDIRIGVVLEPPALDPTAGAAEAIDIVVYQNIFEGLTRVDETGAVQPGLATDWTISEDGLTYTFNLAEGVTFHDGTPFSAEDVVFTFERILADDSVNAQKALYAPIESVTAIDAATVEIVLERPSGMFLFDIGRGDAVIVSPATADTNATDPVGTGPFRFVQWNRGSRIQLARYEEYWGELPALTEASYHFIGDTAAGINALLAEEVDGFNNFASESIALFEADPRFKVLVGTTEGEIIMATNNRQPPFDDLRVRQALAHAIDRQALIDGVSNGFGVPIGSHFAPHHPYYVDLTGTYPHDLEAARALLAEAGFPDGFSTAMKLPPVNYARLGGQILASQFAEIGVTVELINVEWAQWLTDVLTNKDYDLSIVAHVEPFDIGIYADPDYYFGYDDADFQAIISELSTTTDDARRRELAVAAQTRLAEQAVNGFLYQLPQIGVWNAKVEGQWVDSPIEGVVLRDIRWVD